MKKTTFQNGVFPQSGTWYRFHQVRTVRSGDRGNFHANAIGETRATTGMRCRDPLIDSLLNHRLAPSGRSLPPSLTFSKDACYSGSDKFLISDEKSTRHSCMHRHKF